MLNSAACRSETSRAPAEAPGCEKSSRGKGLVQGCRARYRRADETSRYGQNRTARCSRIHTVLFTGPLMNTGSPFVKSFEVECSTELELSRLRWIYKPLHRGKVR